MQLAKVIGKIVSSVKAEELVGLTLLVVEDRASGEQVPAARYVAVDLVGAGEGEVVIVTRGTPAAWAIADQGAPVDAAIVGIVDSASTNEDR